MPRLTDISRKTGETDIKLSLDLDGSGRSDVHSGVGFLDHMLDLLARHGLFDLRVQARGDLHVDQHHTVEDIGIVLGQAIEKSLGDKSGITRYGHVTLPMDETLAAVTLDLSGRPAFVFNVKFPGEMIGAFAVELVEEFFKSVATHAKMNLHANVAYGSNNHHIAEAIFKAFARALRAAVAIDPRQTGVPSSKGSL
jgi:imidazoleglycerol-phosphate dehydratase